MCGRFYLDVAKDKLKTHYRVAKVPDLVPRFNIAPGQDILAVRETPEHLREPKQQREMVSLHWGLIPAWAKEEKTHYSMINARAESVASKPAYRAAFRKRRCLIPASGFYEWQPLKAYKQPYAITLKDGEVFSLAGLWEHWEGPEGKIIESCSIVVTDANKVVAPIHDRMPVIIPPEHYKDWLDSGNQDPDILSKLLIPYPGALMMAYPVSRAINNPSFDEPSCIEPLNPQQD